MPRLRTLWLGAAVSLGIAVLISEVPYRNWRAAVSPLRANPLVIRQDAKGDGRYLAPRSGNRRHRGVDVAAALDTPVRAIRSGRVIRVGRHRGLGRFVELRHSRRLRSLYAHLNTAAVSVGSRVRQGQVIGAVGKTGNARHRWVTPHLHLEVLKDGSPINPTTLGLMFVEAVPASQETANASGGE